MLFSRQDVDTALIAAPPSTKNKEKMRDREMHQAKKGNEWHFGMKLHIGVDRKTGLVHSPSVTAVNVHDSHEVPNLLHGGETRFYGDSAYRGKAQCDRLKNIAPKAKDFTNKRAYKNRPLTDADKATNRCKSSVRSKVEHLFLTLKPLGLYQGSLSRLGEKRQSGFCHAGDAQHQQMGTTAHRSGAFGMSRMQENSLSPGSKLSIYPMKTRFASRFRLDVRSP
jgi:hypothetical protein